MYNEIKVFDIQIYNSALTLDEWEKKWLFIPIKNCAEAAYIM